MSSLVELRSKLAQAPTRLLLGISIMLVSGFIANNLIQINDSNAVRVFVASSNLLAGQRLTLENLTFASVSKSVDAKQWLTTEDLDGAVLKTSLSPGDVLRKSDIVKAPSNLSFLSLVIQKGRVPLNIEVGDVVDVWRTTPTASNVLQRVGVAGLEMSGSEVVITLLVPTEDASLLLEYPELAITKPA